MAQPTAPTESKSEPVTPPPSQPTGATTPPNRNKVLYAVIMLVLISAAALALFYFKGNLFKLGKDSSKVIATVGTESIYQNDLDLVLALSPDLVATPSGKEMALEKLVTDSVALQSAEKLSLIKLSSDIFNSPNKDFQKRIDTLMELREQVEKEKADNIEGGMIMIWTIDNSTALPSKQVPYEQAKTIALNKVKALQADVKSGKMTIQQAGEEIKKDQSLKDIDPAWQSNAYHAFTLKHGYDYVTDSAVSKVIPTLKDGEVSEVFPGIGKDSSGTQREYYYTFVQVFKNVSNPDILNFDSWVEKERSKYEVKYF